MPIGESYADKFRRLKTASQAISARVGITVAQLLQAATTLHYPNQPSCMSVPIVWGALAQSDRDLSTAEIAAQVGLASGTVRNALRRLKEVGLVGRREIGITHEGYSIMAWWDKSREV